MPMNFLIDNLIFWRSVGCRLMIHAGMAVVFVKTFIERFCSAMFQATDAINAVIMHDAKHPGGEARGGLILWGGTYNMKEDFLGSLLRRLLVVQETVEMVKNALLMA